MKLRIIGAALALALTVVAPAAAQEVTIDSGRLDGITLPTGVRAWLGVPFAAPPVRELRWRAPQRAPAWTGVYHAERTAPQCLQTLRSRTMNHYFGVEATSEDCLYLNIWAPPDVSGGPYPVLVWIYGGGFTIGSASMANYSGERLAQKGIIQVNIAYRLGALGFLSHPELTREAGGASGNYGLMDQIAGLEWIRRNIAAFGGDSSKVTIAGQSAGSMSVALLQTSPRAKGLFRGVVGMSGSPFTTLMTPAPLADAERDGLALQQALGASGIEEMRDIAGDRVIATPFPRASPIAIDGRVLAAAPSAAFAARAQSDVPIMTGFTRDESFLSLGPVTTVAAYETAVRERFAEHAAAILRNYPAGMDAEAAAQARIVGRDASLGRMTDTWASLQSRFGSSPAYVWLFTRRQPYAAGVTFSDHDPATVGAYHTGDVPYWLQTQESLNLFRRTRDWGALDQRIADDMSNMLVQFVKTSSPAPSWPIYTLRRPRMLQLGEEIKVIDWPNHAALGLLTLRPRPAPATPARPRD